MAADDDKPGDEKELPETIRRKLESLVPELVKKTFAAGMGAVFSTEEGIRKLAKESLPDMAGYLAEKGDGAKDRVFEIIARETREFLGSLNLTDEIAKILTTLSFEIKTEIRFIPNSERLMGSEPDVKASVRLKRNDAKMPDESKDKEKDKDKDKDNGAPPGDERESKRGLRFWRRDGDAAANDESDEGDSHDK